MHRARGESRRQHRGNWPSSVGPVLSLELICRPTGRVLPKSSSEYCSSRLLPSLTYTYMGRFLYTLVVCVDACFRFKNRLRSSDEKDPTLGPGWSYMVDHGPYLQHVKKYATEAEVSLQTTSLMLITNSHIDQYLCRICSGAPR